MKNKYIHVKVTEEEKKDVEKKAKESGMSVSAYVRHIVLYKE